MFKTTKKKQIKLLTKKINMTVILQTTQKKRKRKKNLYPSKNPLIFSTFFLISFQAIKKSTLL